MKQSSELNHWDVFVLRHRKRPNIFFHILSFSMFWFSVPMVLATGELWWLVAFFLSGLMGTAGHYLFADGTVDKKEASSSPQVVQFSSAMVLLYLTGRYKKHIATAEKKLSEYLRGEIPSPYKRGEIEQKLGTHLMDVTPIGGFHEQKS